MLHLTYFIFPNDDMETDFIWSKIGNGSCYPFRVLSEKGVRRIDFEPITIFHGGNGSGKTTALNVISEKTKVNRDSRYNNSKFYHEYVNMCAIRDLDKIHEASRIITSDDVFDYMLNMRCLNDGIDEKREDVLQEYLAAKYSRFKVKSIADYDMLKKVNKSRSKTQSGYAKSELMSNVREYSNGESAFKYFIEKIGENGLYILDEPENSLSPKRQMELKSYIEDSVRFFGCQFIISTHSPFLLSIRDAKIYNLDENPVAVRKWTELENVQTYYEFFKEHSREFS